MNVLKRIVFSLFSISSKYGLKKRGINSFPPFYQLTDRIIDLNSYVSPYFTYRNNIFWTPQYYKKTNHSFEFKQKFKYFKQVKKWEEKDQIALIQLILTEAIRDTTYEIAYHYQCNSNDENPFNGIIPFLIYNNDPESK